MNKQEEIEQIEIKDTGCCPRFNPEQWEGKHVEWKDKLFVKDHVTGVLHMPLNFGAVTTRMIEKIEKSNQQVADNMMISDENSLWGSDLFFSVDHEVPNAENVMLTGNFVAKVFEGPYYKIGAWSKETKSYLNEKGMKVEKFYYWYTTCPKCAKAYGKNYVVLFAKVE